MRDASASLVAFLASRPNVCFQADPFLITLEDGSTFSWTSADESLFVPPYTYSAMGPIIDRTKWSVKNTVDVPEMEVRIFSTGTDLPGGENLKTLVHNGLLDYATITLSRVFMPVWGDTSLGPVTLFTGNVSQTEITSIGVTITVKGANIKLAQYMPRNQYQLSCIHSVYDEGCAPNPGEPGGGPSRAANTFPNTVGPGSTTTFINWGTEPANAAQFSLGYITFTSGSNDGATRTIPARSGANTAGVQLIYPLDFEPSEGDTYVVTYGCNRTRGGGCRFFNNLQNYRGFPYIPPAEFGV